MQKILNSPKEFVNEMLEGILQAYPSQLKAVEGDTHALVRADAPVAQDTCHYFLAMLVKVY
jgi:dihydroxyacetone kinase-like protein